jgi:HEAT repeat protein
VTRWRAFLSVILTAIVSVGLAGANGDLCSSEAFHAAFMEGQDSVDFRTVSPKLVGFGNAAVPCLVGIADGRGDRVGIKSCQGSAEQCRLWAAAALGEIATPKARQALVTLVQNPIERVAGVAIGALGNLKAGEARSVLRDTLQRPDAALRAKAIVALAAIQNPADFDAMLACALNLPDEHLYTAAQGLRMFGDKRAIEPLAARVRTVGDVPLRNALQQQLDQFRASVNPVGRVN